MNIEIKKSLSVLELSDLARMIEMQEKDIKLVDLSYEKRLDVPDLILPLLHFKRLGQYYYILCLG